MTLSTLEVSEKIPPRIGKRHLQCFLYFWAVSLAFAMRVNFSLGIVAMTDKKSPNADFETYDWSEKVKSLLLSGFFWGYVCTQIPAGYLARRCGGKTTLGLGILISSLSTFFSPLCLKFGDWKLLFIARILQGISQGFVFPSTHTLLANWAPKDELPKLATFSYCGTQFGTVTMFLAGGLIAASSLGWPGLFYVPGILGVLWCICWYFWAASSPRESKSITEAEKSYIEKSHSKDKANHDEHTKPHMHKIPWLKFFTSTPFWALLVVHSSFNWAFWTMLTQIPAYMKNILGFNIKENALLSALPYFAQMVLNICFAYVAGWVASRELLRPTTSRKFFNTIGTLLPAIALIWLGYVDGTNTKLAIVLLVLSIALGSACSAGFIINHIDLSPNFAGIMYGCTNMSANIMGILAPLTVGFVVSDETNPLQWRIIFFISAGFCFFGNLLFLFWGSAKVQPWNQPEHKLVKTYEPEACEKSAHVDEEQILRDERFNFPRLSI